MGKEGQFTRAFVRHASQVGDGGLTVLTLYKHNTVTVI